MSTEGYLARRSSMCFASTPRFLSTCTLSHVEIHSSLVANATISLAAVCDKSCAMVRSTIGATLSVAPD